MFDVRQLSKCVCTSQETVCLNDERVATTQYIECYPRTDGELRYCHYSAWAPEYGDRFASSALQVWFHVDRRLFSDEQIVCWYSASKRDDDNKISSSNTLTCQADSQNPRVCVCVCVCVVELSFSFLVVQYSCASNRQQQTPQQPSIDFYNCVCKDRRIILTLCLN